MGKGTINSLGKCSIRVPIDPSLTLEFEVDIVDHEVPLIFGLEHYLQKKCSSNEVDLTFTHRPTRITVPLEYREESNEHGGHLYLNWYSSEVLYTTEELKTLHMNFRHPTATALGNLIQKSSPHNFDSSVASELEKIVKRCKECRTYSSRPSRFRISFPMDEILFNHGVEVELFWIYSDQVLHIIDRVTRYSVAKSTENETAEHMWEILQEFWFTIFTGYPYVIAHDQGSQFTSDHFQISCSQLRIISKETPTE